MKKWQKISLCVSMALVSGLTGLSAQSIAAGSFHSFKGVGISAEIPSAGISEFNVFTLYADLADVYAGVQPSPGIKFNYAPLNRGRLSFRTDPCLQNQYCVLVRHDRQSCPPRSSQRRHKEYT